MNTVTNRALRIKVKTLHPNPPCRVSIRSIGGALFILSLAREQNMPSSANLALNEIAAGSADAAKDGVAEDGSNDHEVLKTALGKIVRSKGFMWLAFSDKAAMYWSHAGEDAAKIPEMIHKCI